MTRLTLFIKGQPILHFGYKRAIIFSTFQSHYH